MVRKFNPKEARDKDGKWTDDAAAKAAAKATAKATHLAKIKAHPISHKNVVDTYEQATPGEKASGQNWYPNAHKIAIAMSKAHGVDLRHAAGMIATYSPQTAWGKNLTEANEALRTRQGIGGPGAHLNIVKTPEGFQEERAGIMASGINKSRAERILAGEDFQDVFAGARKKNGELPPHSLKIRSFGELIAHGGQSDSSPTPQVVIDRHAAGVARGVRFTDYDYTTEGPSSSLKKYQTYADAYDKASKVLSKKYGRSIPPEEVQAATWLVRQRLNLQESKNRRKLGNRDTTESLNYFASYDPEVASILTQPMTGYAELSTPITSVQDGPRMTGNFGGKKAAPFKKGGGRKKLTRTDKVNMGKKAVAKAKMAVYAAKK